MDAATIVTLIQTLAQLVQSGVKLYEDSKATLSETDEATIKANLASVQALTAAYRTQVDAALDEAAKY